jgi:hypothetical protein
MDLIIAMHRNAGERRIPPRDCSSISRQQRGALLSREATIRLRFMMLLAAKACAEAVRFVNDVVGTSSIPHRAAL